ncbi:MAG: YeeE/YedE thiosulfate transporter family protein [Methylomonas sp.]|jgi:uncharacterized membrane protein YedE/YeeE
MAEITYLSSLAGGALIGAAATLLYVKLRRIAGVSGIAAGLPPPWNAESGWRICFLLGLFLSAPLYRGLGDAIPITIDAPLTMLAAAGLLVGYGARLGDGCTSGHGICGMARLSTRSIAATLIFMFTAGVTVYLVRHIF